jgi:hypothetical protein
MMGDWDEEWCRGEARAGVGEEGFEMQQKDYLHLSKHRRLALKSWRSTLNHQPSTLNP